MTGPIVKLVNIFPNAYDNFIATARTCYSARGIVGVDDVAEGMGEPSEIERRRARKHALAESLFRAGHHTTLQHTHAQFALDRVSRHFIWSFLHSHPFYNSEQVSQRYVAMKDDSFHLPETLTGRSREIYLACARRQMEDYHWLSQALCPPVEAEYYARYKGRQGARRAVSDIRKKAREAARYALPVATHAYLYHTISVITLLRYHRVAQEFDTSAEQRRVVAAMAEALLQREPDFAHILQEPMPIQETPEYAFFFANNMHEADAENAARFTAEFDDQLGDATSIMIDWGAYNEHTLASSVRETLGIARGGLSDGEAIECVLNPARNRLLGEPMNLSTLSKLSRTLFHPHYTFRKKLSHSADSQDQRHRLTPGSRPILMRHYTGQPDCVTPAIMLKDDAIKRRYDDSMSATWETINKLLAIGESPEDAAYLLPNAVSVRFTESGDLLNLHHKMAMRLCFNAQEEIWRASIEEALAIARVNPLIGRWLLPPCALRKHAGQKPVCPEGDRYCGVPVWRTEIDEYQRII
ncbi:MAG: FAD-dependent thymidylate synthase [Candidatus Sumerlaeota bacterium]|nr:FAD-dependent thymidylate synthase [Candidatus Sumerlaeota bacterium]